MIAVIVTPCASALELPEIIGPHMMLQQQKSAKLWGWAKAGSEVRVTASWAADQPVTAQADKDGRWQLRVMTPAASFDVHQLVVEGDGQRIVVDDVLIGEVWFCSGQSNMVMPLMGLRNCPTRDGNEEIALSGEWADRVRVATIPQDQGVFLTPQERTHGRWQRPDPSVAPEFSAVGWFYAQTLSRMLNVPVGVIICAWGGSRVEGWLPESYLRRVAPDEDFTCTLPSAQNKLSMELPMIMFNGMLKPVMGYTVRGFLWYQGESNVERGAATYAQRFTDMVELWRKGWEQPGDMLPFYTVEIAPHWYRNERGTLAAEFRTIQQNLGKTVPNSGCICTNDLMEDFEVQNVHGSNKRPVGQRLAYMAAVRTYGFTGVACDAPELADVRVDGKRATLVFDHADNGFSRYRDMPGFEAAGRDGVFHPANVTVTRIFNELLLKCEDANGDIQQIRYNYYNWSPGRVWNTRGLPIVPFSYTVTKK